MAGQGKDGGLGGLGLLVVIVEHILLALRIQNHGVIRSANRLDEVDDTAVVVAGISRVVIIVVKGNQRRAGYHCQE